MGNIKGKWIIITAVFLLLITIACRVSLKDEGPSPAEKTLEAIYQEKTMTAQAAESSDDEPAPEVVVEHTFFPGSPGSPDVTKDEINTENTADTKTALGDSFRLSNFERPFTADDMLYHPETDILRLHLSKGDDFYYFTFELNGPAEDTNYPSANYGIEIDSDYDGRGDYLLWAKGDASTEWNIDNVMLLKDSNEDVGGSNPVVPDSSSGNGYDEVLFSIDKLDDPDVAWKRVDPSISSNVQLAVKTSFIDNNRFYWRAWADSGLADPAQFDYNDSMSESQAGSPNSVSEFYPVGDLNLMDSTCWIAYNLEPTGTELGGCVSAPAPSTPPPADKPPERIPPPLICPPGCWVIGDHCECIE